MGFAPAPRWLRRATGRGLAVAVLFGAAASLPATAQQSVAEPLVLRPGDAVRVEIRDEPDLTAEYPVSESGQVLFPIIGRVKVTDRPWTEVSAELDAAYGRELANPDFLATPLMRVTVTGEVQQPGLQFADPSMKLADLVALAGGALPTAKRDRVDLVRDGDRLELDFSSASADRTVSLRSGDSIHVPRRSWVSENLNVLVSAVATVTAAVVTTLIVTSGN